MNEVKLGQLIDANSQRDAVHVAIAPMIAAEKLQPGQHVGFPSDDRDRVSGNCDLPIGIVDPFLKRAVMPGERFYVMLYPNSVTSLRHEWTHPAFAVRTQADCSISEKHLRRFATDKGMNYELLLQFLDNDGHVGNREEYCGEIPDQIWDYYEAVTGKKATYRSSYFSCAC